MDLTATVVDHEADAKLPEPRVERFTFFPGLPVELQNLIWEFACFIPRFVEIEPVRFRYNFEETKGWIIFNYRYLYQLQSRFSVPPVLHACHESRRIGLMHYQKTFGADKAIRRGGLSTKIKTPGRIYFNWACDTIVFPPIESWNVDALGSHECLHPFFNGFNAYAAKASTKACFRIAFEVADEPLVSQWPYPYETWESRFGSLDVETDLWSLPPGPKHIDLLFIPVKTPTAFSERHTVQGNGNKEHFHFKPESHMDLPILHDQAGSAYRKISRAAHSISQYFDGHYKGGYTFADEYDPDGNRPVITVRGLEISMAKRISNYGRKLCTKFIDTIEGLGKRKNKTHHSHSNSFTGSLPQISTLLLQTSSNDSPTPYQQSSLYLNQRY
jgi:hypothetical protein